MMQSSGGGGLGYAPLKPGSKTRFMHLTNTDVTVAAAGGDVTISSAAKVRSATFSAGDKFRRLIIKATLSPTVNTQNVYIVATINAGDNTTAMTNLSHNNNNAAGTSPQTADESCFMVPFNQPIEVRTDADITDIYLTMAYPNGSTSIGTSFINVEISAGH